MTFAATAMRMAALLSPMAMLAPATAQTVPAKPVAVPSAPPAWTITPDEARGTVQVAATAKDGITRLVFACRQSAPTGLTGVIAGYRGTGLRGDGTEEAVSLYASGEDWRDAFSVRLRYAAGSRVWALSQPLSPLFLSSFSRGATLSVVNNANQEVFAFDLTGSTAATRALRTGCGLPVE